jgi:hypothetical protein
MTIPPPRPVRAPKNPAHMDARAMMNENPKLVMTVPLETCIIIIVRHA